MNTLNNKTMDRVSIKSMKTLFSITIAAVCFMVTGCATPLHNVRFDQTFHSIQPQEVETAELEKTAFAPKLDEATMTRKISYRYQDSGTKALLNNLSYEQSIALFQETSQLIDRRHFSPKSYGERTRQGLSNLKLAIENPSFLAANRAELNPKAVELIKGQIDHVNTTWTARNADDSMKALRWAVSLLNQQLGINPTATVLEFTNASIDSLDKYSALNYDPKRTGPKVDAGDSIVGIGVEMKHDKRGALIVRPLQNSPAEIAGILKGDLIVAINGQKLEGKTLNDMADMISGPSGSKLLIQIERNGVPASILSVQRGKIEMKSVSEVRMVDNNAKIGYIRIDRFSHDTGKLLDDGLWKLYRSGMKSLIVDVRGNPGGLLTTAISVSDRFVPYGGIVSTKGRNASDNTNEAANYGKTWRVPLVVLVDENSASASEIFAAAIQDNGRGLIVGRKSYGKGTVQTHFQLQSITGNLKLTTAKFYSPKGREMAGQGVTPDIVVEIPKTPVSTSRDLDIEKGIEVVISKKPLEMVAQVLAQRTNGTLSSASSS